MSMRELGNLEEVEVTEIWPHEERNFTPWLADNLDQLGKKVGMDLEVVGREYRTEDRGRVDILAIDKKTSRRVVIENQVYSSDHDHFLRMISYAASTEAGAIIWVAPYFHDSHVKMMKWLTEAGVEVFGVKIGAVKIGEVYAPLFDVMVSPEQAAERADESGDRGPGVYARFYRPLTATLRQEGIYAIGGRQGGWTGRARTFRLGATLADAGITFYSSLEFERSGKRCEVGIVFKEGDERHIFGSLREQYENSSSLLGDLDLDWREGNYGSYLTVHGVGVPSESDENLAEARKWMTDTLIRLRSEVGPKIEDEIVNSPPPDMPVEEQEC